MTTEKNTWFPYANNDFGDAEGVPLLKSHETTASASNAFPGLRRTIHGMPGPPKGHVLIRTAGNALQAVSQDHFTNVVSKPNVLGVPVPGNARSGDCIMVQNPITRTLVQVKIPDGVTAGQMFFCEMPVRTGDVPTASVMPEIPSHELELGSCLPPNQTTEFVLVQIPEGQAPGSRLNVSLANGRTVMAVVPSDRSIREFFMKVPRHDDATPSAYIV